MTLRSLKRLLRNDRLEQVKRRLGPALNSVLAVIWVRVGRPQTVGLTELWRALRTGTQGDLR